MRGWRRGWWIRWVRRWRRDWRRRWCRRWQRNWGRRWRRDGRCRRNHTGEMADGFGIVARRHRAWGSWRFAGSRNGIWNGNGRRGIQRRGRGRSSDAGIVRAIGEIAERYRAPDGCADVSIAFERDARA